MRGYVVEIAKDFRSNNNDWMRAALREIKRIPAGETFTGEDLRLRLEPVIGPPKHHNAWGAVVNTARRRGLIEPTGYWTNMRTPRSHARMTPIYKRTRA